MGEMLAVIASEDLNSAPPCPVLKPGVVRCTHNISTENSIAGGSLEFAGQPAEKKRCVARSVRDPVSKKSGTLTQRKTSKVDFKVDF